MYIVPCPIRVQQLKTFDLVQQRPCVEILDVSLANRSFIDRMAAYVQVDSETNFEALPPVLPSAVVVSREQGRLPLFLTL